MHPTQPHTCLASYKRCVSPHMPLYDAALCATLAPVAAHTSAPAAGAGASTRSIRPCGPDARYSLCWRGCITCLQQQHLQREWQHCHLHPHTSRSIRGHMSLTRTRGSGSPFHHLSSLHANTRTNNLKARRLYLGLKLRCILRPTRTHTASPTTPSANCLAASHTLPTHTPHTLAYCYTMRTVTHRHDQQYQDGGTTCGCTPSQMS